VIGRGRLVGTQSRLRQDWIWAAAAATGLVVFSYRTLFGGVGLWLDYNIEARPAFDALVSGHVADFLHSAPAYGGSLLLRAPFVLAARAFGAGEHWMYRASVIPVLLACGALAWWLSSRMARDNARWLAGLVVVGVCVLNPIAMQAVLLGHPEDLFGAVLCVAAVLCAIHDRPIWAGILLGLAIANKEWALLAVGPVLVALPRRRLLSLLWAAAVAGSIIAPFAIAGSVNLNHGLNGLPGVNTGPVFTPRQIWWFFGSLHMFRDQGVVYATRSPPSWIVGLAHPLIVAISIPLTLLYVHLRRQRFSAASDGLLLLAFLFLLRCVLDPWDISYYATPFLIALVTWETIRFKRLPVLAVTASFFAWFLYVRSSASLNPSVMNRQAMSFLLVSLFAVAAMACRLYLPGVRERLYQRATRPANAEL
jgi:hypothetical protein